MIAAALPPSRQNQGCASRQNQACTEWLEETQTAELLVDTKLRLLSSVATSLRASPPTILDALTEALADPVHLTGSATDDSRRLEHRFAQLNGVRPVLLEAPHSMLCARLAALTQARTVPVSLLTFAYDDKVIPDATGEHAVAHNRLNVSVRELLRVPRDPVRAAECAARLLALPHVRRWYASSPPRRPFAGEAGRKIFYVPIGFGAHGLQMRTNALRITSPGLSSHATHRLHSAYSGLSRSERRNQEQTLLSQVLRATRELQARRDACGASAAARSLVLVQTVVNESFARRGRGARFAVMTATRQRFPALTNHYPALGATYMERLLGGLVSFSPEGTRVDCWRHYEMLAAGTLVVAPDNAKLRAVLADLPILLLADWSALSCARLLSELRRIHAALGTQRPTVSHARLTLKYWTHAVLGDARRSLVLERRRAGR